MSIQFVYFRKNRNGLFFAQTEENCILLRSFLNKNNIENTQYFNNELPNIYDIVDDIISDYSDIICFVVDKDNYEMCTKIARLVYKNEDKIKIIFICIEDIFLLDLEYVDVVKINQAVDVLLDYINKHNLSYSDFSSIELKPYSNNLLPIKLAQDFGVILNKHIKLINKEYICELGTVTEELKNLVKHTQVGSIIAFNSDDINNYPHLDDLLKHIKVNYSKYNFVLFTRINNIDKKILSKLKKYEIECVDIYNSLNYEALINGHQLFMIGHYSNYYMGESTKHIVVNKGDINSELLEKLSTHNAGNSAIYGVGQNMSLSFDDVKDLSKNTDFLLTNYLEFFDSDESNNVNVNINGCNNVYNFILQPYSEYSSSLDHNSYVCVDTRKDFECFVNDFNKFKQTGLIHNERMWKPLLKDRCRYGSNGLCSLTKLKKFYVKGEKVYPCDSCSKYIGNIDDQYFQLLKRACAEKEQVEVKLDCNNCVAKEYCNKCSMLPDFITREEYCNLNKSGTSIVKYVNTMMAIKFIIDLASIKEYSEVKSGDLVISTKENNIEIKKLEYGNKEYFDINLIFIKHFKNNSYFVFSLSDRKAFSINKNMFIICELLNKGLSFEQIEEYLIGEYNLTKEESNGLILKVVSFFEGKGYLKKDVYINELL